MKEIDSIKEAKSNSFIIWDESDGNNFKSKTARQMVKRLEKAGIKCYKLKRTRRGK